MKYYEVLLLPDDGPRPHDAHWQPGDRLRRSEASVLQAYEGRTWCGNVLVPAAYLGRVPTLQRSGPAAEGAAEAARQVTAGIIRDVRPGASQWGRLQSQSSGTLLPHTLT